MTGPHSAAGEARAARGSRPPLDLKSVLRSRYAWHLGFVYMMFGFAYMVYFTFFQKRLTADLGFSSSAAGEYLPRRGGGQPGVRGAVGRHLRPGRARPSHRRDVLHPGRGRGAVRLVAVNPGAHPVGGARGSHRAGGPRHRRAPDAAISSGRSSRRPRSASSPSFSGSARCSAPIWPAGSPTPTAPLPTPTSWRPASSSWEACSSVVLQGDGLEDGCRSPAGGDRRGLSRPASGADITSRPAEGA